MTIDNNLLYWATYTKTLNNSQEARTMDRIILEHKFITIFETLNRIEKNTAFQLSEIEEIIDMADEICERYDMEKSELDIAYNKLKEHLIPEDIRKWFFKLLNDVTKIQTIKDLENVSKYASRYSYRQLNDLCDVLF